MKKNIFIVLVLIGLLITTGCGARRRDIRETLTAQVPSPTEEPTEEPVDTSPTEAPAASQEEPADTSPASGLTDIEGDILFWDDFQDGAPDNWEISASWYVNQDGDAYVFGTSGEGAAWLPQGSSWDNYILRSVVRLDSGNLALNFRLAREGRYLLNYREDCIYLTKEDAAGNVTVLTQADAPSLGAWHWVAIAVYGSHLQVYVDRALALDYTDPNPFLQGTIAVGTLAGSQASVDNVMVSEVISPLPTPGSGFSESMVCAAAPESAEGIAAPEPAGPSLVAVPEAGAEVLGGELPDIAPVEISFTVEGGASTTIDPGQCATTEWNVNNALAVYYQVEAVSANGHRDECPVETTTYVLEVAGLDGSVSEHTVTVTVSGDQPQVGQPDLFLSGVVIITQPGIVGQPIDVVVHVQNTGSADTGLFNVRWYSTPDIVGCSWDINIPAGEIVDLTCRYEGYPEAGNYKFQAIADEEGEVAEPNEGNNISGGTLTILPADA